MSNRYRNRKLTARACAAISIVSFAGAAVMGASTGHAEPEQDQTEPAGYGSLESDFDGDGTNDLAMTGFTDRETETGVIVVDYSSSLDTVRLTPSDADDTSGFGVGIATDDLDSDGYDDLVAGCGGCRWQGEAPSVIIWRGGPDGLQRDTGVPPWGSTGRAVAVGNFSPDGADDYLDIAATDDGTDPDVSTQQSGTWTPESIPLNVPRSNYVPAVEIGDVDGDNNLDLVVGTPTAEAGSVTVIYGPVTPDSQQSTYFAEDFGGNYARFGEALAVDDVDTDGYDDIVIGAPGSTEDGIAACGEVLVLTNGDHNLQLGQEAIGVPGVCEAGDLFGYDLAIGSNHEIIVGVPGEDIGNISNAGAYAVLKCNVEADCTGSLGITQNSENVPGSPEAGDRFGFAVSATNTSTDDPVDLLVSAPGESVGGTAHAGGVFVAVNNSVSEPGPDSYDVDGTEYGVTDLGWALP